MLAYLKILCLPSLLLLVSCISLNNTGIPTPQPKDAVTANSVTETEPGASQTEESQKEEELTVTGTGDMATNTKEEEQTLPALPEEVITYISPGQDSSIQNNAGSADSLPQPSLPPLPEKSKTQVTSTQDKTKTSPKPKSVSANQSSISQSSETKKTTTNATNSPPSNSSVNTIVADETKPVTGLKSGPNEQNLIARKGDELNIRLDKRGWIFLGYNNQTIKDGLRLVNRSYGDNFTHFHFMAQKEGEYQLLFVYQDNVQGIQERYTYLVRVVTPEQFASEMATLSSETATSSTSINDSITGSEFATWLYASGKYEDALIEYLKNYDLIAYRENSPYLNEQIANTYWKLNKPEYAITYWLKNSTLPSAPVTASSANAQTHTDYMEKAVSGIVKSAIKTNNHALFLKHLNPLFNVKSFPVNEELLAAAKYCQDKLDYATSHDILNKWITDYPYRGSSDTYLDEALFLLGKLYEESPKHKDYRKAKDMYLRVYQEFPESFYSRQAHERVNYLNRHYFDIR